MAEGLNRFLGDSPLRTLIKLVIVSVGVGFIMHVSGVSPLDLVDWVRSSFIEIWRSGFAAFGRLGRYFALGVVVVVPLFILIRILSWRKS
jgi:hypothetical protein